MNEFGHWKDFFMGGQQWTFPVVVISIFPGRPGVFKFYFTDSELKDNNFSNFKIQWVQGPLCPLSDAHAKEDNYVHIRQTTLVPQ